jgi:diadenosine tetraphosphate (Ap4A) HIT family hydrolase/5-methylcytosine-specific restriction endonuclease McrA
MQQRSTTPFEELKEFLTKQMRMSHLYQPLMLRTLIEKGGAASMRDIASTFLKHDESQIEYYMEITKRMPGRVLAQHQLVRRKGEGYRLIPDVQQLTPEEREELLRLCDDAVETYTGRRGRKLYDHRRLALGDISGTVRYEVLKRAGHRCELCGIPADERWLEVDHILPRRHGGTDDISNLQALCYKCNANKGSRDDSDLRAVRERMADRVAECFLCFPAHRPIVAQNELAIALYDAHPVTPLHALIVPRRHAETFFDLYEPERRAINLLLDEMRRKLLGEDKAVQGFNVGMNCGPAAGQTIMHCHVHLIPRRPGDVEQPRGGVRAIIPGKGAY